MLSNMTTLDWIGYHLSRGADFKPLARAANASLVGEVYYVDLAAGSDSNIGDTWDHPFLTINAAYDAVTADGNDYIFVRGWLDNAGTGIIATADIAQTHLIGHAGILNPYFPEKGTLARAGAANTPYLSVTAEFVEVAGFSVHAHQLNTTASSGAIEKGSVSIGTAASGAGNKAYVHNMHFPDWNHAETTCGLTVHGSHYYVLKDNVVDSIYGNIDEGYYIAGSSGSNSANAVIDGLWAKGGTGGALATAIKLYAGSSLQSSRITNVFGARSTNLVNFTSDFSTGYCSFDKLSGNMAANAIFSSATTIDARDTLASVMGAIAGSDVYGATIFPDAV